MELARRLQSENPGLEVAHAHAAGIDVGNDVQESQWLLKLHTYGLLNNSFHPPSKIRTLRTYWRQRPACNACRKR